MRQITQQHIAVMINSASSLALMSLNLERVANPGKWVQGWFLLQFEDPDCLLYMFVVLPDTQCNTFSPTGMCRQCGA
jgi:hypothetical protein